MASAGGHWVKGAFSPATGGGSTTEETKSAGPPSKEDYIREAMQEQKLSQSEAEESYRVFNGKTAYMMTKDEFVNRPGYYTVGVKKGMMPVDQEEQRLQGLLDQATDVLEKNKLSYVSQGYGGPNPRAGLSKAKVKLVDKYMDAKNNYYAHWNESRKTRQAQLHEVVVRDAVASGKYVPDHVRKEYGL